jgi:hypothetical protein
MQRTLATTAGRTAAARSSIWLAACRRLKYACGVRPLPCPWHANQPHVPLSMHRTCSTLPSEMTHELCRRFCGSRSAAKPGGFAESGQDPARAWRAGIHRVCRQRRQAKLTSLPQTVMLKWRGRGVPVDRLRLAWNGERINQRVTAAPASPPRWIRGLRRSTASGCGGGFQTLVAL